MGKGGSEAEAILNRQSRRGFLPETEAGTDGWLHSDEACAGHGFLCKESNYYNVEGEKEGGVGGYYMQRKVMAALTDLRDLLLLFFILSSFPSRFLCSFTGSHIHSMCYTQKNKTSDQIYIQRSVLLCRSVRLWAIVSSSLLLLLLLSPSLQLYNSEVMSENYTDRARNIGSNYMTFSQNHGDNDDDLSGHSQISDSAQTMTRGSDLGSLRFQEAPSFHNGDGCPSPNDRFYVCDPSSVHIAMTLDEAYLRGSMAAVFSILQHASCPHNIVFHFLVTEEEETEEMEEMEDDQNKNGRNRRRKIRRRSEIVYHSLLHGSFPSLKFKIYHFNSSLVKDRISSSVRQALEQPLNYARNYLGEMLEACVTRVIYLDSDVVVVDDIAKLWSTGLGPHTIAAPEYCRANFTKYFSPSFWEEEAEVWRRSRSFHGGGGGGEQQVRREACYFNTGVMVMDLRRWRERNCTRRIEEWMEVQKERRIYELGSLPPFLLVFAGSVQPVAHRWNQHGLGGDSVTGSCRPLHPGPVSLLHWSGQGKPWSRLDAARPCPLDRLLWAPFDLRIAPHP